MAKKLNSMRFLEQHDIPYEAMEYPDSLHNAEEVAEVLGLPYDMVYKTLVVHEPDMVNKPSLVMIPSTARLDLKKMAAAAGVRKIRMATHSDAERMTGLKVGGISALALTHKNWPVYLDRTATAAQHIVISAGQRGTQLRVPVVPLMTVLRTLIADVSDV
jgi:Cys-tRNA(Pro)/Cys-tRNA(Cys) deacylase